MFVISLHTSSSALRHIRGKDVLIWSLCLLHKHSLDIWHVRWWCDLHCDLAWCAVLSLREEVVPLLVLHRGIRGWESWWRLVVGSQNVFSRRSIRDAALGVDQDIGLSYCHLTLLLKQDLVQDILLILDGIVLLHHLVQLLWSCYALRQVHEPIRRLL